jgi:hypothetical protein
MFKDGMLQKIGVVAQRCLVCRSRFYIFRPAGLGSILKAFGHVPAREPVVTRAPKIPPAAVTKEVLWSALDEDDEREGRSKAG